MAPLEIERKFLIHLTPQIRERAASYTDIVQTYLVKTDDLQRRVRRSDTDGTVTYTYTLKRFLSPKVREEYERIIDRDEYERLLCEADAELAPVVKTRYIIEYMSQRFEADVYPFSDRYATIELELSSEDQPITLPDFIDVVKEVTGDHSYSNSVLAQTRRFPEE
ncbi:MAG: hypothetical protein IJ080_02400 [Oscillospiraceae bacterium]|nr:hypothetical protein [Oscillospiraceae bacterium]MBQ8978595.1 hypothetical protein [Oscillospiraceae bacterium]